VAHIKVAIITVYLSLAFVTKKKLYNNDPRSKVIKLISAVIYECSQQVRMFVPRRPFRPSLIFVGKAGSLPKSGVPEKRFWVLPD
jgi:hypothetical protein